jgi:hypothetical protein
LKQLLAVEEDAHMLCMMLVARECVHSGYRRLLEARQCT